MPIVHGLQREYGERITFVRANIHLQETRALQEDLGFTLAPEFFLLDADGGILGHWDEEVTLAQLRDAFDRVLEASPQAKIGH